MAAAAMVVDKDCVAAIDALLAPKEPVNQIADQVVAIFQKYGLAHYQPGVTPSQVLYIEPDPSEQAWSRYWTYNQRPFQDAPWHKEAPAASSGTSSKANPAGPHAEAPQAKPSDHASASKPEPPKTKSGRPEAKKMVPGF